MATADVAVIGDITKAPWPKDLNYRDQWARWRVRKRLAKVYNLATKEAVRALPGEIPNLLPDISSNEIVPENLPELPEFKPNPKTVLPAEIKVCIVGAGAAGLFTAMIFDWLKSKAGKEIPDLNISYDIFEANDRLGGRLYTHRFQQSAKGRDAKEEEQDHLYYDVGAMRFPENPIMERTFDLFEYVGLHKRSEDQPKEKLIPYYMKGKNVPTYYNDYHYIGAPPKCILDPYGFKDQPGAPIPDEYLKQGPSKTIGDAIEVYRKALVEDAGKGWRMLMDADRFTTRDFLLLPPLLELKTLSENVRKAVEDDDANPIGGPGFNFNTVEWLETFEAGTNWYSQAFSEMVLESLDFDYPKAGPKPEPTDPEDPKDSEEFKDSGNSTEPKKPEDWKWWCIDGGSNVLAQEMAKKIAGTVQYKNPVTSIGLNKSEDTHNITVGVNDVKLSHKYAGVFNSTTLGALQRMDLTEAKLNLGTKQAIRTLNYGASCKVGILFSKPWWILPPYNINNGGLGKTDLPIRVCVYPSYNLGPTEEEPWRKPIDPHKPAVLLCSYTWEQDASRLGSMINRNSPHDEHLLKRILFENLARLHASSEVPKEQVYETIKSTYVEHHAYNWYQDEHAAGAFAFFGACQFKEVFPGLSAPSADGKLFIIGEAASAHHAWVVGALESALRGVFQFITRYAEVYKEYKEAMEWLQRCRKRENVAKEDRPFLPLPESFESAIAKHQVVLSQARAQGLKDPKSAS